MTWTFGSQAGGTVSREDCGPRALYSCLYAPCVRQEVLQVMSRTAIWQAWHVF